MSINSVISSAVSSVPGILGTTLEYAKRTNATGVQVGVFGSFVSFVGLITNTSKNVEESQDADQFTRVERCRLRTKFADLIDGDRVRAGGKVWTVDGQSTAALGVFLYELRRDIPRLGSGRSAP